MPSQVQLCNPLDCSPPGSSVHGISQARTLESVVISSSRASSRPRDGTPVSCIGRQILCHYTTYRVLASPNFVLSYLVFTKSSAEPSFDHMNKAKFESVLIMNEKLFLVIHF